MNILRRIYLQAILLLTGAALFAQSDRGSITGTVLDPGAAVIVGATVAARNTEAGTVSQTVTTGSGNFTIPSLPAGFYEVSVEAPGFRKTIQPRVQIQVAQTVRID